MDTALETQRPHVEPYPKKWMRSGPIAPDIPPEWGNSAESGDPVGSQTPSFPPLPCSQLLHSLRPQDLLVDFSQKTCRQFDTGQCVTSVTVGSHIVGKLLRHRGAADHNLHIIP
jgi:hypothetical protein